MLTRSTALVVAILVAACGGAPSPADSGVDAGVDGATEWPAPPAPPAPPVFGPCPDGWRERADEVGLVVCEPWPETGYRTDCAFQEAHFAGAPACVRIGPACPADGWPADLPTDVPIVYVDDDAPLGGDGSSRPLAFRSIATAAETAAANTVIAVAVGRYLEDETIVLRLGQELRGACVASTRITAAIPSATEPTIRTNGASVTIRDVSIEGGDRSGIQISTVEVVVRDVVISGVRGGGLLETAGSAALERTLIRDVAPAADGTLGRGITVQSGSRLSMDHVLIERVHDVGLGAYSGAQVDGRDVVIREVSALPDGSLGRGLNVQAGADVTLARSVIENVREFGAIVDGAETSLTLSDTVLRHVSASGDGRFGRALSLQNGAQVDVRRVSLAHARQDGVFASGGSLTGGDLVISDIEPDADDLNGYGISASAGAAIQLERAVVQRTFEMGIHARGPVTTLDVYDLVIRDVEPSSMGLVGRGINIQDEVVAHIERVEIERVHHTGLFVVAGVDADVIDVRIRDVVPAPMALDRSGAAIDVLLGAELLLDRAVLERTWGSGVFIADTGSLIDARSLVVRDVESRASDGLSGHAIHVEAAGTVHFDQCLIERAREAGLFAAGNETRINGRGLRVLDTLPRAVDDQGGAGIWASGGARIEVEDVAIDSARVAGVAAVNGGTIILNVVEIGGVQAASCATTTCAETAGGFGVSAHFGAVLELNDFSIRDSALCGVVVGVDYPDWGATSVDLVRGVIDGAPIGACVQVSGYDTARLRNEVEYQNVGVPLQATTYELPVLE